MAHIFTQSQRERYGIDYERIFDYRLRRIHRLELCLLHAGKVSGHSVLAHLDCHKSKH